MPSAKKSKKRGRKPKPRPQPIERLKQKLVKEGPPGMQFVVEPQGEVKMSEVLERFVDPYLDSLETTEDHRKLFTLAVLAWNASFLPPAGQEQMIDEVLGAVLSAEDAGDVRAELADVVRDLIARKQALFADYTRKIVSFEVIKSGAGFHLSVASTLG